ncbi:MAG: Maf family protein [Solirubrobacterales bacterium]
MTSRSRSRATWSTAPTPTSRRRAKPRSSSLSWPEPTEAPLAWGPGLRLVLASASPQRREILSSAGVSFEVAPTGVEEAVEGEPAWVALENARRKARAARLHHPEPGAVVLAADTVVALDGEILDKPAGTARGPSRTMATSGPLVMNETSSSKNGLPSCSA